MYTMQGSGSLLAVCFYVATLLNCQAQPNNSYLQLKFYVSIWDGYSKYIIII